MSFPGNSAICLSALRCSPPPIEGIEIAFLLILFTEVVVNMSSPFFTFQLAKFVEDV